MGFRRYYFGNEKLPNDSETAQTIKPDGMGKNMKKYILKYYKNTTTTEFTEQHDRLNYCVEAIEQNADIENVKFALICEIKSGEQILKAVRFNGIWKLTKDEKKI